MKLSEPILLTDSQMKIWSGQVFNEAAPLYNMILTFTFDGFIDDKIFVCAFKELVNNNDVFRLIIEDIEGIPHQRFIQELDAQLEIIDFSANENPQNQYALWLESNKTRMFNLGDVLYHSALIKMGENKFIWYLNQHHVLTDGWSMKFAYEELNKYYNQCSKVESKSTSTINLFESYANSKPYSIENATSDYWLKKKDDSIASTALYGRKEINASSHSTRVNVQLGKNRTQLIKALTKEDELRAWSTELAMSHIFLMAIGTLIGKIGDQQKFAIGVPYHGRTKLEHKSTAGLFMEILPVFINIESDETLLSLFEKVRNESFEVIKNSMEAAPPIEALKTFNVVLNYVPVSFSNFNDIPTKCDWILPNHSDPNHHIRLQIIDFNNTGDYTLQFDFNNDVIHESKHQIIGAHFIKILDAFISNRKQNISELSLITNEEISLIDEWNNTASSYDKVETLLTKFENQALQIPDNIALLFEDKTLSYRSLDEQVNQFARFLIDKSVRPNDIVAISLDRSLELMIAIYGIIKAGAAYLPLDTSTPLERLEHILADSQAKILIINHDNIERRDIKETSIFHFEDIRNEISAQGTKKPEVVITQNDLAYVIYTSGSTGLPKGVLCIHEGICNRMNWGQELNPLKEDDTVLLKTPVTFDVSLNELFWPLGVGARLAIEIPDGHKSTDQLISSIDKYNVTTINFVPSMLNVFLENPDLALCKNLRRVCCTGEALTVKTVTKFHSLLNCDLYNLYGPTEASVEVSAWKCDDDKSLTTTPIGHPVANTKLLILDEHLNQTPIGVPGQLFIGGNQLALGYLNRTKLTNELFITNPFSENSDDKIYKTGDLVRYRFDGAIEYLGRLDYQVKFRGFRIELGEIEQAIDKHPKITQSVVTVDLPGTGLEYLLGYYTGEEVTVKEIQSLLSKTLPEYMIPAFFQHVEKFTLLSNGKVDRKKLPIHNISETHTKQELKFPETQFEIIITDVWKEVMKLENISINQDFIQYGGNSLTALVITSRLKTAFELDLSVDLIFTHSTIESYAQFVEQKILKLLSQDS